MATSSIISKVIIDENRCHGCHYCLKFCPRGCLGITKDNLNPMGYAVPVLTKPEQCNTCGLCAQMCPHWAIEVYLNTRVPSGASKEKTAILPRLASNPPFANCSGCQHPTVGRIIAELLDDLGLEGKFIALDAVSCGSSSAFNIDTAKILGVYDHPIYIAMSMKHTHPNKLVFTIQNSIKFDIIGVDSFIRALSCGDKITIINCHSPSYGPWPTGWHIKPLITHIITPEGHEIIEEGYPMHTAELAATFDGVAYSARGAITSPDDYKLTKSYIRTAFQKQVANIGLSFVEVLCACSALSYEHPLNCLKWIQEEMVNELPLREFKNVDRLE